MNREEVKAFLEEQLLILQVNKAADLMKGKRSNELENMLGNIVLDFSMIRKFYYEGGREIYETKAEIPEKFLYELALYMQQSGIEDDCYFGSYHDYRKLLRDTEEEVAKNIADLMQLSDLYCFEICELLKEV